MRLWDVAAAKERLTLPESDNARALTFSADSKTVTFGTDGAIHIRSTDTGKELAVLKKVDYLVQALALTADGKYLASGGQNSHVTLWDLPGRRPPWDCQHQQHE